MTHEDNNEINVITPAELENKLLKENIVILDVREPDEFTEGHIPIAISIPLGDLPNRTNEVEKTKDVYVICRSGARSDFATKILLNNGFNNITNVVPGMMNWNGEVKRL